MSPNVRGLPKLRSDPERAEVLKLAGLPAEALA